MKDYVRRKVWSLLNFNFAIMEEVNVVGLNPVLITPEKFENEDCFYG